MPRARELLEQYVQSRDPDPPGVHGWDATADAMHHTVALVALVAPARRRARRRWVAHPVRR
jgi:hypothetical protein